MGKFIVLLYLFGSALGYVLEPEALEKSRLNSLAPNGRIAGGKETDIREVPYQVGLQYYRMVYCSGVLVSEEYVLTTAQCIIPGDILAFVRVGSSNRKEGGTVVRVEYFRTHPLHGPSAYDLDYDIAVIRLLEKAPLGPNVQPVKVSDEEVAPGTVLKVSGWGQLRPGGDMHDQLHSVDLNAISRKKCQDAYSDSGENITSRMVCLHTPGKGACVGDGGSPAVANGVLYGISSWGRGCGRLNIPEVYVNVADPSVRGFIRRYAKV